MNRKKKKRCFTIIFFFKNIDNLHFTPNNILTKNFKKLTKYKNDYQQCRDNFLFQKLRARPCWNLRQFCCPTLEGKPEPMVEEYHQFGCWFMPYKAFLFLPYKA